MRTSRSIAFMLLSAALAGACLDLSPVPYEGPEGGVKDGSVADVVFEVGSADANDECTRCLASGCRSAETACEQNTKCAKFAACMDATRCWGSSLTDLTNLAPCLVQCGVSSGILGQSDPAATLISPVLACAQDPNVCAAACLGADQ
jgi:hypothetical protein